MARHIDELAGAVARLTPEERLELLQLLGPLLAPEELERQARILRQRATLEKASGIVTELPPAAYSSSVDDILYGPGEFATLPFFGMWADREEMQDSEAYVRREREQGQQRLERQG